MDGDKASVDSSWIIPGAPVVVVQVSLASDHHWFETTVDRVAKQSFTVAGRSERINLDTLQSGRFGDTWNRSHLRVVSPDSNEVRELRAQRALVELVRQTRAAIGEWDKGGRRRDPSAIDDAIDALTALRDALGGDTHD